MAYGYGPHNFRDLAKTVLHLKGRRDGIDMAWVDFAMGHTVDQLGYDQFFNDKEYALNQFRIGEKHLNIMSQHQTGMSDDEIKNIAEELIKRYGNVFKPPEHPIEHSRLMRVYWMRPLGKQRHLRQIFDINIANTFIIKSYSHSLNAQS